VEGKVRCHRVEEKSVEKAPINWGRSRLSPVFFQAYLRMAFITSTRESRSFVENISGTDRYFVPGNIILAAFSRRAKSSPAMQRASANAEKRADNSISTKAARPSRKQAKQTASRLSAKTPTAYSSVCCVSGWAGCFDAGDSISALWAECSALLATSGSDRYVPTRIVVARVSHPAAM